MLRSQETSGDLASRKRDPRSPSWTLKANSRITMTGFLTCLPVSLEVVAASLRRQKKASSLMSKDLRSRAVFHKVGSQSAPDASLSDLASTQISILKMTN